MSLAQARNFSLESALETLERQFIDVNPRSVARHHRARRYLPGGNTRSVLHYAPLPLTLARGEGCRVWDLDDHCYTDFLCEYSAGLYGHSNPVIRAAIDRALDDGVVLGGPNRYEAELAEALTERFPSLELVRFCNSGSEADLMALSAARTFTGREKVLVFDHAYHGGFLIFAHGGSPLNVPMPFVKAQFNQIDSTLAVIEREKNALAAVILEPMMGAAGCIPAQPEFLRAVREATARHGIILVFDEVISSRLSPAGLQGALGVIPDMTTLGKYLGGGLTFGAFGGRADIMSRFDPSEPGAYFHAGTFNNNVLTMAAGLAGISRVFTPEAAAALNAKGDGLRERLATLLRERGVEGCVSGLGSLMNLHFVRGPVQSPADLEADSPRQAQRCRLLHLDLLARGQYVTPRGMLALSLPMGDRELEALIGAVSDFIDDHAPLLR